MADFGIALAVQQAGGQRMTQTGLSLGTPQYMAPSRRWGRRQSTAGPFHIGVTLPPGRTPAHVPSILLSPDGTRLVFNVWSAGQRVLHSQRLGELDATPITGTEGAQRAFFSPDGRWIAFNRGHAPLPPRRAERDGTGRRPIALRSAGSGRSSCP